MTEYRIKISYSTGDSNGSEDTEDYLELTWSNLDVAKENLQRIKEHNEMYEMINNLRRLTTRNECFDKNKDKDWFVNKPKLFCISSDNAINEKDKGKVGDGNWEYRIDPDYAEHCINLKTDDGNIMQMRAFWVGYFELLHAAYIEINDTNMKFTTAF